MAMEETVIHDCEHGEAPAVEDPSDEIVLDVMWAQVVERHILAGDHLLHAEEVAAAAPPRDTSAAASSHGHAASGVPGPRSAVGETVYLLQCTRGGGKLHSALDHGRALDSVRTTAASFGQSWALGSGTRGSGARIFVHPDQYDEVLRTLSLHKLRPHHVIVSEAFLPLVYEDLTALPSKANIRKRFLQPLALVTAAGDVVPVQRTFLHSSPNRNCETATQSDSQAWHLANPRV